MNNDIYRSDEPAGVPMIEPTVFDQQAYGQAGNPAAMQRTELLGDDQPEPIAAWLIFTGQGQRFGEMVRLRDKSFLIGRASDCDLILDDNAVSRQHTKIRIEGAGDAQRFIVHDLATDNGTFVNGSRQMPAELQNGDIIKIGRTELTFKRIG
jgi:pSer/pThr/pTyr-binding forkhead associated (FHA) protein